MLLYLNKITDALESSTGFMKRHAGYAGVGVLNSRPSFLYRRKLRTENKSIHIAFILYRKFLPTAFANGHNLRNSLYGRIS